MKVPAHRLMLGKGSAVFYSMLYGGLSGNVKDAIEIPDIEEDTFDRLLW